MGRYFIEISYNGANYSGWQIQANAPSVQETVESVARKVLRQPQLSLVGSSRTDAGVHALRQIAQMDFEPEEPLQNIVFKLNMALPADISVIDLFKVKEGTKARYDAIFRHYRYVISCRKDPFWLGRSLYHYGNLDVEKLNQCAEIVLHTVDFEAFSKVKTDVNHFECRVEKAHWEKKEHFLIFEIKANRFLRGMVRALVGTMLDVGKGKISVSEFQEIVLSKSRNRAGENVPACGLYLLEVGYPEGLKER